jgi:hypothetical protein
MFAAVVLLQKKEAYNFDWKIKESNVPSRAESKRCFIVGIHLVFERVWYLIVSLRIGIVPAFQEIEWMGQRKYRAFRIASIWKHIFKHKVWMLQNSY